MRPDLRKICFLFAWSGGAALLLFLVGSQLGRSRVPDYGYGTTGGGVTGHLTRGITDHPQTGLPIFLVGCFALGATMWAVWNASKPTDGYRGTLREMLSPARMAFGFTAALPAIVLVMAGARFLLTISSSIRGIWSWGQLHNLDFSFLRSTFRSGLTLAALCFGLSTAAWAITTIRAIRILGRRS